MEVHVSLVGRKDLAGEIYRQLRAAILQDRLRPGDQLPPSRELARRLGVSRTTVTVAYDRLNGEGLTAPRVGAGTFVEQHLAGRDSAKVSGYGLQPRRLWDAIPTVTPFDPPAEFDFRTGLPDATLFPHDTWRRLLARESRERSVGRGIYGDPAGHPRLRDAIAHHLAASRGVAATADDVVVTNGTQQALDLVARVLLAPGDRVAVEDPGYPPPAWLFESLSLRVTGVPVDDHGLVVDALPSQARLVYVTPSHQYPLGMTMTLPRRTALLAWAQRHEAAVVEDDYDSEFRYGGRPLEPLQTLDTTGQVIYVGSFSKTMLPTLRLGFLVTPPTLRRAVQAAKFVTDWHTPLPIQAALASFIEQGWLARHVRRTRAIYERRHDLVVEGVRRHLSRHLTVLPVATGLHVSATADATPTEVKSAAERASDLGVAVQPLSTFQHDQPAQSGLVLGYGAIDESRIDEGLRRLGDAFE